jgi:hypothetical protein
MTDFAAGWDSFYVIVGAAAGALIGLQYVVMTLMASRPPSMNSAKAAAAFATPTIVHFCAALLLCALMRVPWPALVYPAASWGLIGAGGFVYTALIGWRMGSQTVYRPVLEDWAFHLAAPIIAYGLLAAAAPLAFGRMTIAEFAVAAATLTLLFVGIHNAWDATAYHVFVTLGSRAARRDGE